jgi:hypothetical protein
LVLTTLITPAPELALPVVTLLDPPKVALVPLLPDEALELTLFTTPALLDVFPKLLTLVLTTFNVLALAVALPVFTVLLLKNPDAPVVLLPDEAFELTLLTTNALLDVPFWVCAKAAVAETNKSPAAAPVTINFLIILFTSFL